MSFPSHFLQTYPHISSESITPTSVFLITFCSCHFYRLIVFQYIIICALHICIMVSFGRKRSLNIFATLKCWHSVWQLDGFEYLLHHVDVPLIYCTSSIVFTIDLSFITICGGLWLWICGFITICGGLWECVCLLFI